MFSNFLISRHPEVTHESSDTQNKESYFGRCMTLCILLFVIFFTNIHAAVAVDTSYTVPPRSYVYIRTNPIIDDSWIGTLVKNIKKPTITTLSGTVQPIALQDKNPNWINDWKQSIQVFYTTESD